MRGCWASLIEEVPSLGVTLSVSLLSCGSPCVNLGTQSVFADTFSAARTASQDEDLKLPPALENCIRLDWGLEHRMTPSAFICIGLKCLTQLTENENLVLRFVDQIQFPETQARIQVKIDPDYIKYPEATTTQTITTQTTTTETTRTETTTTETTTTEATTTETTTTETITTAAGVEMNRALLVEHVLSQLARYVSCPDLPDADLPGADLPDADLPDAEIPDAEIPDDVKALWQHYATAKLPAANLQKSKEEDMRALYALRARFSRAELCMNEARQICTQQWRGVCRPRLGLNDEHRVAVVKWLKGGLCPECTPQDKTDLRAPARVRALADGVQSDGSSVCLSPVTKEAVEQVKADAEVRGLGTVALPPAKTWHPWKGKPLSDTETVIALQELSQRGCLIPLHELLKTYRLSPTLTTQLVEKIRQRLKDAGKRCCVGSYSQVYVTLECRERFGVEKTKLGIVLARECMEAMTPKKAIQVTDQFIERFKHDAGYYARSKEEATVTAEHIVR
ncbi:hypothetical protein GNI_173880 [Gregarina niphandrodes]|uniref:Uncharacterized protein n=1 Tax=Gregarina niphandrodes TaxID=110365 RepID=A0A023AYQ1_GRENI|nr:hypothetical protein GNI_173880 [Gregarina niphandrodes]EZG43395.1 hypothetical protein GNI_173880 [Gregarina niphandrodes]|eukprot:XP_011133372.1 hypothetical protein GNI_173880 [Gregarina niphandrodes]